MTESFNLFDRCQYHNPKTIAIRFKNEEYSYSFLVKLASKIAVSLNSLTKSNSSNSIALWGKKDITYYASVLACEKNAISFVPLNPKFPQDRLKEVSIQAKCSLIICSESDVEIVKSILNSSNITHIICVDKSLDLARIINLKIKKNKSHIETTKRLSIEENTAYTLFTSGSTGTPKGIAISRKNLSAYIKNFRSILEIKPEDRMTQFFELSFDLSIHDIYLSFCHGACLCIPSGNDLLVPSQYIHRNQITIWFSVPSLVANMDKLKLLKPRQFESIRASLFCGEPLTIDTTKIWSKAAVNSRIINLYGPTEATIATTAFELSKNFLEEMSFPNGYVPIGFPFGENSAYILNTDVDTLKGKDEKRKGELVLCGDQISNGYINNEQKTKECFIKSSSKKFKKELQAYLTGDIVQFSKKHGYLYLKRKDTQIKINGHRIELEEIEFRIREVTQSSMVACVTIFSEKGPEIVCHWQSSKPISPVEIKKYLLTHLPKYMLPSKLIELEKMPLNSNGKIDRRHLSELQHEKYCRSDQRTS